MVFCWIIRQIYVANLWLTVLVFEYHDILWVYEYEIECFKASLIMRRLNAWLRPYRIFTKHIVSYVNSLEHTRVGHAYKYLCDFLYFSFQRFFSWVLLINNTYVSLLNSPLFGDIMFFVEITFLRVKNTLIWVRSSRFGFRPSEWKTIPFQHNKELFELSKHWVFQDYNFKRTHTLDSFFLLDSVSTFFKGAFTYIKNIIKTITDISITKKYVALLLPLVSSVASIIIFSNLFYFSLFKNFGLYIVAVIFLYILVSTYFHFSKTYAINKYTSQTQRFWKRTFGVFWGLEFTLFIIYMYFTLTSPAELASQSINHKEIITGLSIVKNSQYHIFYLLVLVSLNLSYVCLLILKKKNNFHFIGALFFFINLSYYYIVYYEFLKFYYVAGWGTHTSNSAVKSLFNGVEYNNLINTVGVDTLKSTKIKVPNSLNNSWNDVCLEKQWVRTFRHFVCVTILLKFWHIFFIYVYFALTLLKFTETGYVSFDSISSNHQNTFYIIWFYLFSYIIIIKKKVYFFITFVYYWSFVQINYSDFISMLLNEFNFVYIL